MFDRTKGILKVRAEKLSKFSDYEEGLISEEIVRTDSAIEKTFLQELKTYITHCTLLKDAQRVVEDDEEQVLYGYEGIEDLSTISIKDLKWYKDGGWSELREASYGGITMQVEMQYKDNKNQKNNHVLHCDAVRAMWPEPQE